MNTDKNVQSLTPWAILIIFGASVFLFNFSFSAVQADIITQGLPVVTPQLLAEPIFRKNEQSIILVNPRFNDDSTNIAFYAECPTVACPDDGTLESPKFIFFAENLGHGHLPFPDYWTPDPSFRKLVAVEYFNDAQQFTCSDLSLDECVADSHLVSQFSFEIVDDDAIIPVSIPSIFDFIDSGAIPDDDFVPVAPLPDSPSVIPPPESNSTSSSQIIPAPVIQENEDGSVMLIAI